MKTVEELKAGDTVWTRSRHSQNARENTVKSIGRVWITLADGDKYHVQTLHDKNGLVELILDIDQWKIRQAEKAEYRSKMSKITSRLTFANEKIVSLDQLRKIAEILCITDEGKSGGKT